MTQEKPLGETKELKEVAGPVKWAMTEIKTSVDLARQGNFSGETDVWIQGALVHIQIAEEWLQNVKASLKAKEVTPALEDQLRAEGYYDYDDEDDSESGSK